MTLVLSATLTSAYAAPTKSPGKITKEIFTAHKKDFNNRMYLYIYCLANTEHRNDITKATGRCVPVLDNTKAFDSRGLDDRITADFKPLNPELKDMIFCISKEANNTSILSDSSAVSFCEVMVNPTAGIEI